MIYNDHRMLDNALRPKKRKFYSNLEVNLLYIKENGDIDLGSGKMP